MFTKRSEKILFAILALLAAVLLMAAASRPDNTAAVIWGRVELEHMPWAGDIKTGTCGDRNYYVSPCPDCAVWLEWAGEPPSEYQRTHYPLRLEGTVYDDMLYGCQVMLVTQYSICAGVP